MPHRRFVFLSWILPRKIVLKCIVFSFCCAGFNPLDLIPGRVGVPQHRLSGFEKFEAPDPAEWTAKGYAIVNPDPRGTYDSQGNI